VNENVEHIMLEHLRAIRGDVSYLKTELSGVRAEMLGIKHHIAAFIANEVVQDSDLASLKMRLDRIERRLDLVE
jgi:hypothetical protein